MPSARKATSAAEPSAKRAKTDAKPSAFGVGDPLPSVTLQTQDGESVDLAERYADSILVLFAYPRASTPGCTKQTSGFGDLYDQFQELGAAVYGISADTPKAQSSFKAKTGVEFDLLSDPHFELLQPLGGKKNPKSVVRSHWVFVNGKAVLVEHQVKPAESPEAALEAVKEHAGESAEGDDEAEEGDATVAEPADEDEADQSPEEPEVEESSAAQADAPKKEELIEDGPEEKLIEDGPEEKLIEDQPEEELLEDQPQEKLIEDDKTPREDEAKVAPRDDVSVDNSGAGDSDAAAVSERSSESKPTENDAEAETTLVEPPTVSEVQS